MKNLYDWVPWFQALAKKIADNGKEYLVSRAKQVDWDKEEPRLLQYGDKNIDPFSFFYFVAQCNKRETKTRERIYKSLDAVFEVSRPELLSLLSASHEDFKGFIIPTPPFTAPVLFFPGRDEGNPDLLWSVFRCAVNTPDKISHQDFNRILNIGTVGVAKLTQCLFIINPISFMPIDEGIFESSVAMNLPSFSDTQKQISGSNGLGKYQAIMKKFKFSFPGCSFYEINTALHLMGKWKERGVGKNFFHVGTQWDDPNDPNAVWGQFSKGNYVRTHGDANDPDQYPIDKPSKGDIVLVKYGMEYGFAIGVVQKNDHDNSSGTGEEVIHVLWLNKQETKLAGNTARLAFGRAEINSGTYQSFANAEAYKPTFALLEFFNGQNPNPRHDSQVVAKTEGSNENMKHPLNQILYGPPGTGKTYHAIDVALEILDPKFYKENSGGTDEDRKRRRSKYEELRKEGRIEFVTFHQSFGYEEFVEGIRPVMGDETSDEEKKEVSYKIEAGVFKRICQKAAGVHLKAGDSPYLSGEVAAVWKISLGASGSIKEACFSENTIRVGWSDAGDFRNPNEEGQKYLDNNLGAKSILGQFTEMSLGDLVAVLHDNKHIDAVGIVTGEYEYTPKNVMYPHSRKVEWIYKGKPVNIQKLNGGNPLAMRTCYQLSRISAKDLLELIGYENYQKENKPHVLIVDEINRGNVSRIFGELITLIEKSKRQGEDEEAIITLPYSRESFGVPNNLYIIGTMNTADRSIALLDTALRRRFRFGEMMPQYEQLNKINVGEVNIGKLLKAMNERIEALYDRDHQIGHSYFLQLQGNPDIKTLQDIFHYEILPLLQEYFYDDWEKVDAVLNLNGFLRSTPPAKIKYRNLLGDEKKLWSVDDKAMNKIQNYQTIYEGGSDE